MKISSFITALLLLCFSYTIYAFDKIRIKTGVSEGFKDGLHSKYLRYIANKLQLGLSIDIIPFARRIKEIEKGNLDIIIGVQRARSRDKALVYISPSYESLSYRFFSLSKNSHQYLDYPDLHGKIIAVNRDSKYFERFNDDEEIAKLETVTLTQTINLLLHERIDLFIHYEESALPKFIELGISGYVIKTPYQPQQKIAHFIAISAKSQLMLRKKELENIIIQGIKNNDFSRIREKHYAQTLNNNIMESRLLKGD